MMKLYLISTGLVHTESDYDWKIIQATIIFIVRISCDFKIPFYDLKLKFKISLTCIQ